MTRATLSLAAVALVIGCAEGDTLPSGDSLELSDARARDAALFDAAPPGRQQVPPGPDAGDLPGDAGEQPVDADEPPPVGDAAPALPDRGNIEPPLRDAGPVVGDCRNGDQRGCADVDCPHGTQTCVSGRWSACVGGPEACDGIDNDCDGTPDEDFPGQTCCSEDWHCAPVESCVDSRCEGGGGGAGCGDAQAIRALGVYPGDSLGGSAEQVGSCGGLGSEAVFALTLDQAQRVRIDTNGSLVDTVMYIRTDCADPFSEISCDDDGGEGVASQIDLDVRAGQTWYIFVDSFLVGGLFQLTVDTPPEPPPPECRVDADCGVGRLCRRGACEDGPPPPDCAADDDCEAGQVCEGGVCVAGPPADGCADPIPLGQFGRHPGNTSAAASGHDASCSDTGGAPELVYTFHVDADARIRLDTSGAEFDTVIYVRTTCDDPASEIACDDDGGDGLAGAVEIVARAGVQYYVFVDGYLRESGPFELDVRFLDPPVGGQPCGEGGRCAEGEVCLEAGCVALPAGPCADAIPITGPGRYDANTAARANGIRAPCGGSGGRDQAFVLAVTEPHTVRADTLGSDFDTVLYALEDCATPAARLACDDDISFVDPESEIVFRVEPGHTYFLVVDGYNDRASGAARLNVAYVD